MAERKRLSPVVMTLATLLGIAACGVVVLVSVVLAQAGANSGGADTAPTATATRIPTATPSQHALAVAYVALVEHDARQLSAALDVVSQQCKTDVTACDTAVVAAATRDQDFLHDIQRVRVPVCLQAADGALQDALSALYAGLMDSHTGLQAEDSALVTQGAHEITAANTKMGSATTLMKRQQCP